MLRVVSAKHGLLAVRRMALLPVLGTAMVLGGCSADFLRFDSPVFGLNGDKSAADERIADTTGDSSLYDQRAAAAPVDAGQPSGNRYAGSGPLSRVNRMDTASTRERGAPQRMARAEPIIETPNSSAEPTNRNSYTPVTTGALPSQSSVTVEPGDTLYQISRRHGVSVSAIRRANGLTGNVIRPGQKLVLPGAGDRLSLAPPQRSAPPVRRSVSRPPATSGNDYVVRSGDSLYAISRRTGVSVADLKRINGITNVRTLKPGQRLALGGQALSPAPATRVASGRSEIRSKSIKTMPIVRQKAPSAPSAYQPRILNQRPETPIATKPKQKVAMVTPASTAQKFRWPARGRVIAPFNHSGQGTKNDGINIALPFGAEVAAAADGVVAYAGSELKGYGNLVLVRHDNGWVSAYAHASQVLVKRGDRITRGQVIANVGRSGGVSQPQLHFELRKGAKPVDPMPHLEQL